MSQRTELLDHERRKLALLRAKVAEQEARVKVLESISEDPFDAILERELAALTPMPAAAPAAPSKASPLEPGGDQASAAVPAPLAAVFQWGKQPRTPRQVPQNWVSLLRYIGLEGKTYEDVKMFIKDRQLSLSEGAARTQLMIYRKEFGFVENPRKGFYKATERALSFLDAQEGKASALQGGGLQSQPIPLTRDAA